MLEPKVFKSWIDATIREAQLRGMPDEEILFEFIDQVRFMLVKQMLEIAGAKK